MYKVVIHHKEQGQKAIAFETTDRTVARQSVLVGKAAGVKVDVTETVEPRPVKFKGID